MIRILLAIVIAGCVSCGGKNDVPSNYIQQREMQNIMWEMVSAGEFLNGYVFVKDTAIGQAKESQEWYNKIFSLHHVSKDQFESSLAYYKAHPNIMRILLDSLSNRKFVIDSTKIKSADSTTNKYGQADSANRKRVLDSLKLRMRKGPKKQILKPTSAQ